MDVQCVLISGSLDVYSAHRSVFNISTSGRPYSTLTDSCSKNDPLGPQRSDWIKMLHVEIVFKHYLCESQLRSSCLACAKNV